MSVNAQWRKSVQILSKKFGLTLRADAATYLKELIQESELDSDLELSQAMDAIAQAYMHHQGNAGQIINGKSLKDVVESLRANQSHSQGAMQNQQGAGEGGEIGADGQMDVESIVRGIREMRPYFHVIDLFKVNKWDYCTQERAFIRSNQALQLHATASLSSKMLRDRYELIKQRIMRNENFRPPTFAAAKNEDYYEITPIKNLSGCKPGSYLLFGMLTQMSEGRHHLEDPGAFIELEFTGKIQTTIGLFTHNCFVLVEGEYTDRKTFRVVMMGLPPSETRDQAISMFGYNPDIFGAPREANTITTIGQFEKDAVNVSFVILSDVWLDDPKVLAKLRLLFEGYSTRAYIPLSFIFIGNFTSRPYIFNGSDFNEYKDAFKTFADLIHEFPDLNRTCQFVFVPGPSDPWGGNMIPRPPIPEVFLARMRGRIPNAVFASNPARIKYCNQEIVIFREDLMSKMRRNCIIPPDEEQEPELKIHLAKTIMEQSHLCPLPIDIQPRYAAFDHGLRLYPLPHLIVLADKYDAYCADMEGCQSINPGSFGNQGCFMTYSPSDMQSVRGMNLRSSAFAVKTKSRVDTGSAHASSRWIDGVLVKDAACQTTEQFQASAFDSVDWTFMKTCKPTTATASKNNKMDMGCPFDEDDQESEDDEFLLNEICALNLDRVCKTVLTPVSNFSSAGSSTAVSPTAARSKAPDADRLLQSKPFPIQNILDGTDSDSDMSDRFGNVALDATEGFNCHAPVPWTMSTPPPANIMKPQARRPTAATYQYQQKQQQQYSHAKMAHVQFHHSTTQILHHQQIQQNKYPSSSSTSSTASSAGYYQYHQSQHTRTGIPTKSGSASTLYQPSTPMSEYQSRSVVSSGSAFSEDENSSVASGSYRTLVSSSIGSPDYGSLGYELGKGGKSGLYAVREKQLLMQEGGEVVGTGGAFSFGRC
ncbi:UNVERIFIED_CONTAM: DNA polymerase epsilon subunit 2 [Siphonaria sp. JEL0065]|nr:DNA polymerase epsilon subunit 2 [Siphonaria sp. JEL0065]